MASARNAAAATGAEPTSLRERKKAKTRRSLIEVSQRLFSQQGYAGTTLEEICEEVEIRPQTLLRYFDSKAHLALAPQYDALDLFREKLTDPERAGDTIAVWRDHIELNAKLMSRAHARSISWVADDPVLVAMSTHVASQYTELLAAAFAAEAGVDPAGDLHSHLLAALLVAGNNTLYKLWLEKGADPETLRSNQIAVVDFAVERLGPRSVEKLNKSVSL